MKRIPFSHLHTRRTIDVPRRGSVLSHGSLSMGTGQLGGTGWSSSLLDVVEVQRFSCSLLCQIPTVIKQGLENELPSSCGILFFL